MKLCVLMPAYNEAKFIKSAIASVFPGHTLLDITLIVVDDGSTDDTAAIVEDIARANSAVRLIRKQNQGIARARNLLLESIPHGTDYVTFLDGDDAFAPDYLTQACQRLAADPALEMVYGQLCLIDSDSQNLASEPQDNSLICRMISLAAGIYRPALLAKTGKIDTAFEQAEDMDYLLRLFESAPNVHLSDQIAVLYRQHAGNSTKNLPVARRFFARAVLGHIRRRKADPTLASVKEIFNIQQMGAGLTERRTK